jgi:hypothetical protein
VCEPAGPTSSTLKPAKGGLRSLVKSRMAFSRFGYQERPLDFKRGQLRNFVTVAEDGQMTRAARKLRLAQPALSQAISQLESELGLVLSSATREA